MYESSYSYSGMQQFQTQRVQFPHAIIEQDENIKHVL
jgi:hypothetical protein